MFYEDTEKRTPGNYYSVFIPQDRKIIQPGLADNGLRNAKSQLQHAFIQPWGNMAIVERKISSTRAVHTGKGTK